MNASLDPGALVAPDGPTRLVLTAQLEPVGHLDRFQPAGFPEIGHVIYDAPRGDDGVEKVCIVDSPASMANHLESVCMRSPFDPTPVEELKELPYLRCVTDPGSSDGEGKAATLVATSLSEGHRMASDYFLRGVRRHDGEDSKTVFEAELGDECGLRWLKQEERAGKPFTSPTGQNAVLLPGAWWGLFRSLFRYDPNSLVHGVLFQRWLGSVQRFLAAHLEAFGAGRVDRSGVKFDQLKKTTSGQPIFAVDDETADRIRATFIFDLSLLRSFGREGHGLGQPEKQFLAAFGLWKVGRLLAEPFRYRSGCDLSCVKLDYSLNGEVADLDPAELAGIAITPILRRAIAGYAESGQSVAGVTDIYWPPGKLYREAQQEKADVDGSED